MTPFRWILKHGVHQRVQKAERHLEVRNQPTQGITTWHTTNTAQESNRPHRKKTGSISWLVCNLIRLQIISGRNTAVTAFM
jgi:hypothetical protein